MTSVSPQQVLAFRLATQRVAEPGRSPLPALGEGWAIKDSPPGSATAAALARTTGTAIEPGWLDGAIHDEKTVVSLYNARTATSILPAAEASAFGAALDPGDDDRGLQAILGRSVPEQKADFAEPVAQAVDAIAAALDGQALSRDALHAELRKTLPEALLPWCEGCQSHHARRGLLVMASLRGRLCISGREGRQPVFSRTDQWAGWSSTAPATARAGLARRYLHWYGPSTPAALADWAGVHPSHARLAWSEIEDELTEVTAGGSKAWVLAADTDLLAGAPAHEGVTLLPPGDPLLSAKDREVLVADEAVRKKVWTAIPTIGVVLLDGRAVAIWKAKKSGKRLDVTVIPIGAKGPVAKAQDALLDQAERLAPHRGAERAAVTID